MAAIPIDALRVQRSTRLAQAGLVVSLILIAIAASLPLWGESSWLREFVEIACYFIFASMWNLLAGYGGMVSIGQQAFFGLGGYAMLAMGNLAGINPFVAVPLAALAAGAVALPVSWIAFRLQGGYFAIGPWVIAEVFRLGIANLSIVGGGSGTSLTALRGIERTARASLTYWIALACVVATIGGVYLFLRSKQGLALLAIRDNEVAAESQGIAVRRMKLAVYVVAAVGAGLAGALYFVGNLRISPDAAFSVNWTAFAIFMGVIGGVGRIEGPMIGALVFWAMNKALADFGSWYLMGLGGIAIASTLLFRQGLWNWLQQRCATRCSPPAAYSRSDLVRNIDEHTITEAGVRSFDGCDNSRLKQIMTSLVRHVHDFVRDVKLTEAEWMEGIRFLTDTGQKCTHTRQEFILLSDTLGISMLTVALNHPSPEGITESTVFGPFYVDDAPALPQGADISNGAPGEPMEVDVLVTSVRGAPVGHADVRVWQADEEGLYDVQRHELGCERRGRAKLRTDAEGRLRFRAVVPTAYPVPTDGPVGCMLVAAGRHPWRPAHLHFMIQAPAHETLITHLFIEGDPYLDSDTVFGVRRSLVVRLERGRDGRQQLRHTFVLNDLGHATP